MNANTLLTESFDRQLTPEEQSFLNQALARDPELKAAQIQLRQIREGLAQLQVSPKIGFADAVMSQVSKVSSGGIVHQLARLLPRLTAAAVLVATFSLLSIYFTSDSLDTDSLIGYQDLQPEEAAYVLEE